MYIFFYIYIFLTIYIYTYYIYMYVYVYIHTINKIVKQKIRSKMKVNCFSHFGSHLGFLFGSTYQRSCPPVFAC